MKTKTSVAAAGFIGMLMTSGVAMAELAGNIGVTSNYIWRGVTQNKDEAAVSGGIDYAHEAGFYFGTWVSNLADNQYEHDLYGGYGFKAGDVDLDVGYIQYLYPVGNADADFSEVYLNASYQQFGAGVALTLSKDGTSDDNDLYLYATADFEIKKDLNLNLLLGNYSFDAAGAEDYTHYRASISKDDFSFALDKNDKNGDDGDMRISVSWSKSIDL